MAKREGEERFLDFIMGSDKDFYETFLVNLSEEELQRFLEDNPDFAENMNAGFAGRSFFDFRE